MAEIKYTIPFEGRTKKNHQMIAGAGRRCTKCGKHEKQWIRQGKAHDNFAETAAYYIRPRPPKPIECPVNVKCLFYMGTRRKVDKLNLEAAIHDLLVETGVLADDNRDIIATTDGTMVLYDKDKPRVEITITKVDGYEQWKPQKPGTKSAPADKEQCTMEGI